MGLDKRNKISMLGAITNRWYLHYVKIVIGSIPAMCVGCVEGLRVVLGLYLLYEKRRMYYYLPAPCRHAIPVF